MEYHIFCHKEKIKQSFEVWKKKIQTYTKFKKNTQNIQNMKGQG